MSTTSRAVTVDKIVIDTLRLTDTQWYECVSEMDRAAAQRSQPSHGQEERVPYRNSPHIMIETRAYDGRQQYIQVRPYDLSCSGIGFLNGRYIHTGTEVVLHLRHCETGITRIPAMVRGCSHIKDTIHCIHADFDERIKIDDFLLAGSG